MASALGPARLKYNKDIKIPVPWGHLAAKVWGSESGTPVLALHGWLDNAGTFDTLAPLLPPNIKLVCVEFCGHGLSSPYPPGMFINYYDHIFHIKLVIDYFKWEKVTLLAHSLGAHVAVAVAAVYPEKIERVISLDVIQQMPAAAKFLPFRLRSVMDDFQEILTKVDRPPSYMSYEEAREKYVKSYGGSITAEDADILLLRSLAKKSEKEFYLTRDLRNVIRPYIFTDFTQKQLIAFASNITCPLMIIKARQGVLMKSQKLFEDQVLDIYRKGSSDFRFIEVEGTHHIHLNAPHLVAPFICDFLSPLRAKL